MAVYFFLLWLLFVMIYELIMGVFDHLKEGFWGYYERITERIDRYTVDSALYGQDELLVKTLNKQKQELEDIMGQYVFYRFCERISVYLTQVDTVVIFCVSIATVVFMHSALLLKDYFWLIAWAAAYTVYMYNEVSGTFIKFEIWATNLFLKQYKTLNRSGSAESIVESKKTNKKIIKRMFFFLILPVSVISFILLEFTVIYPLLPKLPMDLETAIFIMWSVFIVSGIAFVVVIPLFLDKVLNARLKIRKEMFSDVHYAVYIYLFLTLLLSTVISIAKYTI
jgi:hypothetical protein